jgi:glucosamine-6-phosphate deaminase
MSSPPALARLLSHLRPGDGVAAAPAAHDGSALKVSINSDKVQNGVVAARFGAQLIINAIAEKGSAHVILATGASQFEMLQELVQCEGVDWTKVDCIHLDEYVGMDNTHGASFAKYLQERFVDALPADNKPKSFTFVSGVGDPQVEVKRLHDIISSWPEIDVSFIGIGENGHLAFNDPPCDLSVSDAYLVVDLDEACRAQQMGEGWFPTMDDVPKQAISMSMQWILKPKHLVVTCPDERKSTAVKGAVEGPMGPACPGSYLRTHPSATLFIDTAAACQLS